MKWSEKAWDSIVPIYNKTIEHPFIQELMNGTLDREKFIFYIQQDAIYISDYGKVLTGIATRLKDPKHIEAFIYFAGDAMSVEKILHQSFIKEIVAETKPSPGCLLYTSYLLRQLANEPVEVILAAVLPCFWIYKKVGDYILEHQAKSGNPYQSWIDAYGGEEFANSVKRAIDICDEIADRCTEEQKQVMTEAFIMCSKLEYVFWDSAYKLEKWSI